jgi:hypothetical protein
MADKPKDIMDDRPPFLGSWNKIYLLVFGELVFLVVLFYFFTKAFS